ncbi:MAG: ATP synthase subunit C [Acutalibacteraceae bacterium]|nr:ATP synthase subunit C [Acutalibacteraceae bacterium]
MMYVLIALPLIAIIASVFFAIRAVKKGKKAKTAFKSQVIAFAAVAVLTFAIPMVASATTAAEEANATTTAAASEEVAADTQDKNFQNGMGLLAAGFVTAISGIGGGIAVAAAAPAAIGATSEDPKVFGKALIFVALGEGIALYGLLISILILNKVA